MSSFNNMFGNSNTAFPNVYPGANHVTPSYVMPASASQSISNSKFAPAINNLIEVDSIQEAMNSPMGPNSVQPFFDRNQDYIYVKATNAMGEGMVRAFATTEVDVNTLLRPALKPDISEQLKTIGERLEKIERTMNTNGKMGNSGNRPNKPVSNNSASSTESSKQ